MLLILLLMGQDATADWPKGRPKRYVTPTEFPGNWVTDADYPAVSRRAGEFGIVQFRLDVDAKGAVIACHILRTSGYWRLDEYTCELLPRRARFRPALDAEGRAMAATYTNQVAWNPGGDNRAALVALAKMVGAPLDLVLTVKRMPRGYLRAPLVRFRFGAGGGVTDCRVEQGSGNAQADRIACEQGKAYAKPFDIRVAPQFDTRMARISFETDGSQVAP